MNAREVPAEATTSTTAPGRSFAGSSAQNVLSQPNDAVATIEPEPGGIVTDAVAVELLTEPASGSLITSVKLPTCGVTRTFTVAVSGMLAAERLTVTGPVGGVAKLTSG